MTGAGQIVACVSAFFGYDSLFFCAAAILRMSALRLLLPESGFG
jgi:hypothetical protein